MRAWGLGLAALLVGCGHDYTDIASSLSRDTSPSTADVPQLAADEASFAFDLYKVRPGADATSNVFYSPYSIQVALAMQYAGAAGETAQQMATAMHFSLPPARLHEAFDAVDLALDSRQGVRLDVANSLWADRTVAFVPSFLDTLAVDYGNEVRGVDFLHAASQATTIINGWVSAETNGKINNLFAQGSLTADTRVVLVNAIYFDASWKQTFDPSQTQPGPFTRLDGSTADVPMMTEAITVPVGHSPTWDAVEIPYSGGQTSMLIVEPTDGQFAAVETALGADLIAQAEASLTSVALDPLSIPKFTIPGATVELGDALAALGMVDAFDASKADFSPMVNNEPVYVSHVVHQAYVRVDESGTEAAAATGMSSVEENIVIQPPVMLVNRPFFFFIRDIPTNMLLFVGRVMDPTQ